MNKDLLALLSGIGIILIVAAFLLFITNCGGPDFNYKTESGWRLHTKQVSISKVFKETLGDRLDAIEDCAIGLDYDPIPRDNWVIKLKEQKYFSKCNPWEEFLELNAPEHLCIAKEELAKFSLQECPCRYRTTIKDYNIIVPMRSVTKFDPNHNYVLKTEVHQLNLWDLLRAEYGHYWYMKSVADCVGGCE